MVEPVMVANRTPDANELAMAATKGLHWDPWKQAYFDKPATNPICGQEGCPVQIPHGHTSVPDWRSYECPDIDQGADDSHMVFPEEEPLPTHYGPAPKNDYAPRPWEPTAPYYVAGGIDARDVIEAFGLNFNRGAVMKYILRGGRKPGNDALLDMRKAREHIDREIAFLERQP